MNAPDRERWGLLGAFGVFGVYWGAWSAVLPDVERSAHVTDGTLGLALGALALSAVPAMPLAGRLVDRVGARVALPGALLLFALASPLAGLAGSAGQLVAALLVLGAATGILDVVANAATAGWERNESRPLMSAAHGTFSLGVLVGSGTAGLARQAGADALVVLFAVMALVGLCLLAQPVYRLPRAVESFPAGHSVALILAAFGALTACAFLLEDAIQSWSALHLERGLGAPPSVSGLGPALFAGSMAVGRFSGGWISARWSEARTLGVCGLLVSAGALILATAASAGVALVGLVVAGAGASVMAPVLYSAVGARAADGRQGADLATVTALGYAGFVAGPPLVGLVSAASSLPTALGLLSLLGLTIAVGGPALLGSRVSRTSTAAVGSGSR